MAGQTAPYYTYNHSAKVVTGETCPTGGSSISGVAFYPTSGGSYPAAYAGRAVLRRLLPATASGRCCPHRRRPARPGQPADLRRRRRQPGRPGHRARAATSTTSTRPASSGGSATSPATSRRPRSSRPTPDLRPGAADRELRRPRVLRPGPGRRGPAALRVGLHQRRHGRRHDRRPRSFTYPAGGPYTARLRVRGHRRRVATRQTVAIQAGNTAPTAVIDTPAGVADLRRRATRSASPGTPPTRSRARCRRRRCAGG